MSVSTLFRSYDALLRSIHAKFFENQLISLSKAIDLEKWWKNWSMNTKNYYYNGVILLICIAGTERLKIDRAGFAERLIEACDHANVCPMNQGRTIKLAEMMGVDQRSTSYWFSGETLPSSKKRERLSEILNVSLVYLETGTGDISTGVKSEDTSLPVVPLSFIKNNDFSSFEKKSIPSNIEYSKAAFISIVEDDSMSPIAYSGTEIVVDPEATLKNQKYVLIYDSNENTGYVRKVMLLDDKIFLTSLSDQSSYQQLELSHQEVIGKIIAIYNVY
jgi:transcriptional regulator with XRE-family HTH domain|tara:strand:+ start:42588 stop:43412 length:825 start_codon:yes stop_codon:yes gene_type:complete